MDLKLSYPLPIGQCSSLRSLLLSQRLPTFRLFPLTKHKLINISMTVRKISRQQKSWSLYCHRSYITSQWLSIVINYELSLILEKAVRLLAKAEILLKVSSVSLISEIAGISIDALKFSVSSATLWGCNQLKVVDHLSRDNNTNCNRFWPLSLLRKPMRD